MTSFWNEIGKQAIDSPLRNCLCSYHREKEIVIFMPGWRKLFMFLFHTGNCITFNNIFLEEHENNDNRNNHKSRSSHL
jgi:hypothetical protein